MYMYYFSPTLLGECMMLLLHTDLILISVVLYMVQGSSLRQIVHGYIYKFPTFPQYSIVIRTILTLTSGIVCVADHFGCQLLAIIGTCNAIATHAITLCRHFHLTA